MARLILSVLIVGIATGWLHTAELVVERRLFGHFAWYSREFAWMSPAAYSICVAAAMAPLALFALVSPKRISWGVSLGYASLVGAFGLLLPYQQLARPAALALAAGMAVQVARFAGRREAWFTRSAPRLVMGQLLVVGLTVPAVLLFRLSAERRTTARLTDAPEGAPNVLFVILDTVRATSLSLYGFGLPTSPNLARWAAGGTTFDWAIAPAPWTLPSHGSMFSGRWPGELTADFTVPLDDSTPVLAEAFRDRGYHTAAFVANLDYTAYDSGLLRGFTHAEDYPVTASQLLRSASYTQTNLGRAVLSGSSSDLLEALRSLDLYIERKHDDSPRRADAVTGPFLDWQRAHGDRPFFAFLNYFDAHDTYYAPASVPRLQSGTGELTQYHTAISWIDRNLDTLFSELQRRGVLDNTVVIVAGDHGELFNEHGLSGHTHNLFRSVLHVPLVVRYPGRVPSGHRVSRPVSLRDLAATVVDLAGLTGSPFPGRSLAAAWRSATPDVSPAFATVERGGNVPAHFPNAVGRLSSVFDDSLHYIRNFRGREALFDYRRDPFERLNLARSHRATMGGLREALDSLLASVPSTAHVSN